MSTGFASAKITRKPTSYIAGVLELLRIEFNILFYFLFLYLFLTVSLSVIILVISRVQNINDTSLQSISEYFTWSLLQNASLMFFGRIILVLSALPFVYDFVG
jgi:hypothetical protein